jgi:hypothetical protein
MGWGSVGSFLFTSVLKYFARAVFCPLHNPLEMNRYFERIIKKIFFRIPFS